MAILILVGIGIVMIYSSSAIRAEERFHDSAFFLKRQVLWAAAGMVAMRWAMTTDYRRFERIAPILLLLSLLLLLLVLVPTVGVKVNGARRWLRIFGLSFQPSELAKFSLMVFLASFFAKKADRAGTLQGFPLPFLLTGAFVVLIALEPNMGTATVLLISALALFFVGGCRAFHLFLSLAISAPFLLLLAGKHPYVKARLFAVLDPSQASPQSLYQLQQSLYALGPGGLLGRGLGDSVQKLFYLPEPHTDFIFAIVGEEMGFVGSAVVVILFGLVLWRGTRIALRAPDLFGCYLSFGITFALAAQAAINFGVVVGLLPTTGIPLPFVSFGGSSLLTTLLGMGILLNISKHTLQRDARLLTPASRPTVLSQGSGKRGKA